MVEQINNMTSGVQELINDFPASEDIIITVLYTVNHMIIHYLIWFLRFDDRVR